MSVWKRLLRASHTTQCNLYPILAATVTATTVLSHVGKRSTATLASSVRMLEATMSGESTVFRAQRGTPARTSKPDTQS